MISSRALGLIVSALLMAARPRIAATLRAQLCFVRRHSRGTGARLGQASALDATSVVEG